MKQPTLSVLISNFNHARFLPEALGAILAQSYQPAELIIIDDHSTDNSVEIIEQFARAEPRITFIRNERNMGILHNMQRLLALASGDCLFFAACDDKILPGFFEQSMELLTRHPQAGLSSTLSLAMDEGGNDLPGYYRTAAIARGPAYIPPARALALLRKRGNWFHGNTAIYRRAALMEIGGFRAELGSFTDGFACQVVAVKYGVCFIPKRLGVVRIMPTNYSATVRLDTEVFLDTMARAKQLMSTDFADLFPPRYIRDFDRQNRYAAALIHLSNLKTVHESYLARLAGLLGDALMADRIFLRWLHFGMRLRYLATRLYLFLRLRHLGSYAVTHAFNVFARRFFGQ